MQGQRGKNGSVKKIVAWKWFLDQDQTS